MNAKKSFNAGLAAAALLGAYFILRVVYFMFRSPNALTVFELLAVAAVAVMFFLKKRDMELVIVSIMPVAMSLLYLLRYTGKFISLLELAGWAGLWFLAAVAVLPQFAKHQALAKKLWFVPGAALALSAIVTFLWALSLVGFSMFGSTFLTFVFTLVLSAGVAVAGLWLVNPDQELSADTLKNAAPVAPVAAPAGGYTAAPAGAAPVAPVAASAVPASSVYCGLVKHILLLLFTCGIWLYIWIYRVTAYLNTVRGSQYRNPTTKLLLCLFVPFYYIYWTYKTAQLTDQLAREKGMNSDMATLCLILSILIGIIPPILIQDKLNNLIAAEQGFANPESLAGAYAAATAPVAPVAPAAAPKSDLGVAEELKTYKELLDTGAITQEEFDAKKKQLLGL